MTTSVAMSRSLISLATLLFGHTLAQPIIQSATLTPSLTSSNGAKIISHFQEVSNIGTAWDVSIQSQSSWQFILSLDSSWGFDPLMYSAIQITVDSPSIATGPNTFDWLSFGFTSDNSEYISVLIPMENVEHNRIYPGCDTSTPPTMAHGVGDIASAPDFDRSCDIAGGLCVNWRDFEPVNLPSQPNNFPITFLLENDPRRDTLILSFRSASNTAGFEQQCGFVSSATGNGLKLYIGGNDPGQSFQVTSFNIEAWSQTESPTKSPTLFPTSSPSKSPSKSPTKSPTRFPTRTPTSSPSKSPTRFPTTSPTKFPTLSPSKNPTKSPTFSPSNAPSNAPSLTPSNAPSFSPSNSPSNAPTLTPSAAPSNAPSNAPSTSPSNTPSNAPSLAPSNAPSFSPSNSPSNAPSQAPSNAPSSSPTAAPSNAPSAPPTNAPSFSPSSAPSGAPTLSPSHAPSFSPSLSPSSAPSFPPTNAPTSTPTLAPSMSPIIPPTNAPSLSPTPAPTNNPSTTPTDNPTNDPTLDPTNDPTTDPSMDPTIDPTSEPSNDPTSDPSQDPSRQPTSDPSVFPSVDPTLEPTVDPTEEPSSDPSGFPSVDPTVSPTEDPTLEPTFRREGEVEAVEEGSVGNDFQAFILPIAACVVLLVAVLCIRALVACCKEKEEDDVAAGAVSGDVEQLSFINVGLQPTTVPMTAVQSASPVIDIFVMNVHFGPKYFKYIINLEKERQKMQRRQKSRTHGVAAARRGMDGCEDDVDTYIWNEQTYNNLRRAIERKFKLEFIEFGLYEKVGGEEILIDDIEDIVNTFESCAHEIPAEGVAGGTQKSAQTAVSIDIYVKILERAVEGRFVTGHPGPEAKGKHRRSGHVKEVKGKKGGKNRYDTVKGDEEQDLNPQRESRTGTGSYILDEATDTSEMDDDDVVRETPMGGTAGHTTAGLSRNLSSESGDEDDGEQFDPFESDDQVVTAGKSQKTQQLKEQGDF